MNMVETAFLSYRQRLVNYACKCLDDYDQAEDIVQDVFLRVQGMRVGVRAEHLEQLLFSICRRLVIDALRRRQMVRRTHIYMYEHTSWAENHTEQVVLSRELASREMQLVAAMPPKRQRVYDLSRYEGKTVSEIADSLSISPRTVEAHLLAGRKEVREKLKAFAS